MKRSISLRIQIIVVMALLVFLQSLALLSSLAFSRVFFMLDAESFRLFNSTTNARTQTYNAAVGRLVGNTADEATELNARIASLLGGTELDAAAVYLNDESYAQVASLSTETLLSLLANNTVSGAFVVFNGSNANKALASAHSAIYIRNAATGSSLVSTGNYQMEIGPVSVSQQYKIPTSVNWRLDMELDVQSPHAYYSQPMWAASQYPKMVMEHYGYWSPPLNILEDGQQVVTYTMPLLDGKGKAFGVVGVEISMPLFTQYYLPNTDLPYQNSFYAIARVDEGALDLRWYIPSGPLAQVYLRQSDRVDLHPVARSDLFEVEMDSIGSMYCSTQPLSMYSRNSPFVDESWTLIGFVPKDILHETSSGVRSILLTSIAITTTLSFAAIFVLTFIITRKISGLSRYIQSLTPQMDIHFTRTGIREIDELTAEVEKLNRNVMNASKTTSRILELTLLPMGGFEIMSETNSVVLTEYIYRLLGLDPAIQISREAWQQMYTQLIANPVPGYENTYLYKDFQGEERWLRIVEAPTDTGRVGAIVDASKDIQEQRRLAHELDFDALTHLFSRTAFKREVYERITTQPDKVGAMIFIDLDNLKYMNDTFGHDMGDRMIIRAGEMFRQFELYGGVISRISGDEFAIYLHGFESKLEIREIVRKVYARNADYVLITPNGQTQRIRFSSGIAFYPDDSDNMADLIKLSDYAMYEAKHSQKGAVFEFNKESYRENIYVLENREAINLLLDEGLIRFAYQPIVDLRTGTVFAFEALMRPLLDNFKSPLEILTVAGAQSKLGQLERLVFLMGFQAVRDHQKELGDAKLFLNSIPSQLISEEDQIYLKREFSDEFSRIVVEITEVESNSPEQLERKRTFLKGNGMMLAIDDFGSGYSNEVRILAMMPDIVKIDMELISGIDTNRDKQQLVGNLLSFCHPKGIRLVAEGVERREELAMLIRMGMDFVQGYYVARPNFEIRDIEGGIRQEILDLQEPRDVNRNDRW